LRVVIVGGGIGGLTTAVALRRAGIAAHVYEQAPELHEVGAGIGLWANAIHVFEALGLGPAVLDLGAGPLGGGIRSCDGRWLTRQPAEVLARRWGAPTIAVLRTDLQALLVQALPDDSLTLDARATALVNDSDRAIVTFEHGEQTEADLVIGADGLHSVIRAELFGARPPRYRGYTTWRGVTAPGIATLVREASEFWGRGERFGVLPARGDRVVWYASANVTEGSSKARDAMRTLVDRFGRWTEPVPSVLAATPPETIVCNDVYDRPLTRQRVARRAALVGDAAQPMTPDLGQGACQAIVDAWTITDSLTRSTDVGSALAAYQHRRWRIAAAAAVLARNLGRIGQWEQPLACRAREAVLRVTPLSLQLRQLDAVMRRR
jgi:2-polyprenyl-6-methoxyphenol hydroxylase-like FAD-dependent oxidoreductase